MSYILDALRRAEAERELGRVPGLNAQPLPGAGPELDPDADDGRAGRRGGGAGARWWPLAAGAGVAVAGLAVAAWIALRPSEPPARTAAAGGSGTDAAPVAPATGVQASVSAPRASSAAPVPVPVVPPTPAPAVVAAPPPPAPAPAPAETAARPAPSTGPSPPPVAARRDDGRPRAAPDAPAPSRAAARPLEERAAARVPAPAAPAVPALADLDPAVRAGLPTLAVGGSVYSADAANRMVILDGVLAREGDTVAGGLVVERIGPRSAVLRRGDLRFSIRY